jgi:hypothetical protein
VKMRATCSPITQPAADDASLRGQRARHTYNGGLCYAPHATLATPIPALVPCARPAPVPCEDAKAARAWFLKPVKTAEYALARGMHFHNRAY